LKIKSIKAVKVRLREQTGSSKSRRPNWNNFSPRAMPVNFYSEFSNKPGGMPGGGLEPVWVQVIAEDGTWGLGQCAFGSPVASFVNEVIAPILIGRNCLAIEHLYDLILRVSQRFGTSGTASTAMGGVDLALWDLKGKILDQPVYALLGGPVRESITCYVTGDDLDWAQELGFTKFKITNPAHYTDAVEGIKAVVAHVAQAREQVGSDHDLMINPVMSYNVDFAQRLLEELRPYTLRWLEEPLVPTDTAGLARLRQSAPWVAIATGEDHHGRHAFLDLVERRAADILQPDLKWGGGLTEAMKVHTIGEMAGIATIPHGGANDPFGQHFAMAATESPMAEYWMGTDPGIPLEATVTIPGTATPVNGQVKPTDAPGFGLEFETGDISDWTGGNA
jgi:L-rhamnonate dehydratase|tara:strand:- start:779 stop:1954 length:1176 start_codon:yes stop_codon:yes gene_type:complete